MDGKTGQSSSPRAQRHHDHYHYPPHLLQVWLERGLVIATFGVLSPHHSLPASARQSVQRQEVQRHSQTRCVEPAPPAERRTCHHHRGS